MFPSLMKLIQTFRKTQDKNLLSPFKFKHNGKKDYSEIGDDNYMQRKDLIVSLLQDHSLQDKKLIKWLLKQEIKYCAKIADVAVPTTDLCAFLLYLYVEPQDVFQIFKAKYETNYDNSHSIDTELLLGKDIKETKRFLKKSGKKKSKKILKIIRQYEKDLKKNKTAFKSREAYIEYYQEEKLKKLLSYL